MRSWTQAGRIDQTYEIHVTVCVSGRWGHRCEKTCDCGNSKDCNPITGECTCDPGRYGPKCLLGK